MKKMTYVAAFIGSLVLLSACNSGKMSESSSGSASLTENTLTPSNVESVRRKAEGGDAVALYAMGLGYLNGGVVEINTKRAEEYFQKAGNAGHARAASLYGYMLMNSGKESLEKFKATLSWFEFSEKKNDPTGIYMANLFRILLQILSENISKEAGRDKIINKLNSIDYERVLASLKSAADNGDPFAQTLYAEHLIKLTIPNNTATAIEYLTMAHNQDFSPASSALVFEYKGFGEQPKNVEKINEINLKLAKRGDPTAQSEIASAYYFGNRGLPTDYVLSYAWANLARAKLANRWYVDNLFEWLENKLLPSEVSEAQRLSSAWKLGHLIQRQ